MWGVCGNGIEERRERGRNAAADVVGGKEGIGKGGKRERIDSKEKKGSGTTCSIVGWRGKEE